MAAFGGGGGLERLREHRAAERAESERLHSLRAAGVTNEMAYRPTDWDASRARRVAGARARAAEGGATGLHQRPRNVRLGHGPFCRSAELLYCYASMGAVRRHLGVSYTLPNDGESQPICCEKVSSVLFAM